MAAFSQIFHARFPHPRVAKKETAVGYGVYGGHARVWWHACCKPSLLARWGDEIGRTPGIVVDVPRFAASVAHRVAKLP